MSKCGPEHIGNRTCKSERSVGAKDPCNDAAVDVARDFLADRALKPATVQRVLSSSEIPRRDLQNSFLARRRSGRRYSDSTASSPSDHSRLPHIPQSSDQRTGRAAYLKTRNARSVNVAPTTAEADRFAANLMPIGDQKKFQDFGLRSLLLHSSWPREK